MRKAINNRKVGSECLILAPSPILGSGTCWWDRSQSFVTDLHACLLGRASFLPERPPRIHPRQYLHLRRLQPEGFSDI
jgi:hypothetical protein